MCESIFSKCFSPNTHTHTNTHFYIPSVLKCLLPRQVICPWILSCKMCLPGVCSYSPYAVSSLMFRCIVSKQNIYREQPTPLHRPSFTCQGTFVTFSACVHRKACRKQWIWSCQCQRNIRSRIPQDQSKVGVFQYLIYGPCSLWVPGFSFWKAFRTFPQNIPLS